MVEFKEFSRRFGMLPAFIKKEGKKILKGDQQRIIDMVKAQQHAGVNVEGEQMQGGYSKGYRKRRSKKGLQTGFVDLHFTGKMHKGLKVRPVKSGVDVRSHEPYEYYVRANFPKSFGLIEPNAELIASHVANLLAVQMKKFLVA